LNKQYTKEEYEKLKAKIIEHMKNTGEWGTWFPSWMSTFSYNESIVNEYVPRIKEEAQALGYKWKDTLPITLGQENIKYEELPKNSDDYTDDLLKYVLKCAGCSRNYRLISREIACYKKLKLAIPQYCFNCRHERRMKSRLRRKLWHRTCMCDKKHNNHEERCEVEFDTSYAPDRPEIIYCEKCYQQEVY
jgi:hypothetical protein